MPNFDFLWNPHLFVVANNHRNSDTALLRLLVDEDSAVVVFLVVGEHVDVQQGLLSAQPVARARWPSGLKVDLFRNFDFQGGSISGE